MGGLTLDVMPLNQGCVGGKSGFIEEHTRLPDGKYLVREFPTMMDHHRTAGGWNVPISFHLWEGGMDQIEAGV